MESERRYTLAINVVGGTGFAKFDPNGHMKSSSTKAPPMTMPTYDFDVMDDDGFGLTGRENIVGDMTMSEDKICTSQLTVTISGATIDGIYLVRFYFKSAL